MEDDVDLWRYTILEFHAGNDDDDSQQRRDWLVLSHVDCFSQRPDWLVLSRVDCFSQRPDWLVLSHVDCFSQCLGLSSFTNPHALFPALPRTQLRSAWHQHCHQFLRRAQTKTLCLYSLFEKMYATKQKSVKSRFWISKKKHQKV